MQHERDPATLDDTHRAFLLAVAGGLLFDFPLLHLILGVDLSQPLLQYVFIYGALGFCISAVGAIKSFVVWGRLPRDPPRDAEVYCATGMVLGVAVVLGAVVMAVLALTR